ncbi:hypothetical protein PSTG_18593, partial [Puccinia striiformis f. sp. tritici PST-78]
VTELRNLRRRGLLEVCFRVQWTGSWEVSVKTELNQLSLNVLSLVNGDTVLRPLDVHAEKKYCVAGIFDLEFGLHFSPKALRLFANNNQVVDVAEDDCILPTWHLHPVEHTRIGLRDGEADGF